MTATITPHGETAVERDRWHDSWSKAQFLYPLHTHGMPAPTWAVRGFTDDGPAAWDRLTRLVPERQGPISIYVHLPFCMTRCPFCDCHATVMPRKSTDLVERYVNRVQREIEQWRRLGMLARRPVTTVHLGGGTPHALPPLVFERVVRALSGGFATDAHTEWAIETNCRCLDEDHAGQLARLGFTRIHVGVQTLRPRLRALLGRHDAAEQVLARIEACLRRGWVVSVDMLYGLPEQTVPDLLDDLQSLVAIGVHGLSLYRLNHGGYNHRFMVRHGMAERGPDRLFADYRMFMEGANLLMLRGYAKNHFTHFASRDDQNLYSRHAVRGEDLLALGTTADGVFGDYYFRHGNLADYLAGSDERPSLQGGGHFTETERHARKLVTQLMSGQVFEDEIDADAIRFVRKLADTGLLCREDSSRSWKLTDTGSWFITKCTEEAFRLYETVRTDKKSSDATGESIAGDKRNETANR